MTAVVSTVLQSDEIGFYCDDFGSFENTKTKEQVHIKRFTWFNSTGIKIQLITYGGTITCIEVPSTSGEVDDIVMGFDNINDYVSPHNPYFGSTIGRVANRISGNRFYINGVRYNTSANKNNMTLHGGFQGFDKVLWGWDVRNKKVVLSYVSPDMEEGFPGTLVVNASFEFNDKNEFHINFTAMTTQPTPVNISHHSYFNLAGHDKGRGEINRHRVCINADSYTITNVDHIPTGEIKSVSETSYDLRVTKSMEKLFKRHGKGFDNNFCLTRGTEQDVVFAAKIFHSRTGRILEIYTDQPGLQFYTSNFLPGKEDEPQLLGKQGTYYHTHGALCLATQNYPDAVNQPDFPNSILRPGDVYTHKIIYRFILKTE